MADNEMPRLVATPPSQRHQVLARRAPLPQAEIVADAAWHLFHKPKSFSGNFLIDDTFLADNGVMDFDPYRVDPSKDLLPDFSCGRCRAAPRKLKAKA